MKPKSKTEARRELAAVFLRDASYGGLSLRSRIDAAFDAVYVLALVLIGEEAADGYAHPDPEVLWVVKAQLGESDADLSLAVRYIEHRYDYEFWIELGSEAFEAMLSLALRLQSYDELARQRDTSPKPGEGP